MSGLGFVPFGFVPFGLWHSSSGESKRTTVTSSRAIDTVTGRYVLADSGDFAAMGDLEQCVYLLLARMPREPGLIGRDFEATIRANVTEALRPIADEVEILDVRFSYVPGNTYREVIFRRLGAATESSVRF